MRAEVDTARHLASIGLKTIRFDFSGDCMERLNTDFDVFRKGIDMLVNERACRGQKNYFLLFGPNVDIMGCHHGGDQCFSQPGRDHHQKIFGNGPFIDFLLVFTGLLGGPAPFFGKTRFYCGLLDYLYFNRLSFFLFILFLERVAPFFHKLAESVSFPADFNALGIFYSANHSIGINIDKKCMESHSFCIVNMTMGKCGFPGGLQII